MAPVNLRSMANDLSFYKEAKNGIKVFKGIGKKGEEIVASAKPGESSPSFAVVKHPPKNHTVSTQELNQRVSDHTTQTIEVLRNDAEPQFIIKNAFTPKSGLEHTHYMTVNELTGRAISRDVFPTNPGFNEIQMTNLSDFKRIK